MKDPVPPDNRTSYASPWPKSSTALLGVSEVAVGAGSTVITELPGALNTYGVVVPVSVITMLKVKAPLYVGTKPRLAVLPTGMSVTLLATPLLFEYTRFAVNGPVPPESVVDIMAFWPISSVFVDGVTCVAVGAVFAVSVLERVFDSGVVAESWTFADIVYMPVAPGGTVNDKVFEVLDMPVNRTLAIIATEFDTIMFPE